jgi:hypothetical protein
MQNLIVKDPSDAVFYGNMLFGSSETYGKYSQTDNVNNVERIVIPAPVKGGTYIVRVATAHVVTTTQGFSLVVTGTFVQKQEDCSWQACPSNCSNHGVCMNGACACDMGFFGPDCGVRMPRITNGVAFPISVSSSRWSFYAFYVDNAVTSWTLSFKGTP